MHSIPHQSPEASKESPAQIAAWNRILFQALVQKAESSAETARFEAVLEWASVAGWFASREGGFGWLNSRELEAELLRAAQTLPGPAGPQGGRSQPRRLQGRQQARS